MTYTSINLSNSKKALQQCRAFLLFLWMAFSIKDSTARINWRQIVIHMLAFLFFMYAFEALIYLFHLDTINTARASGFNTKDLSKEQVITTDDLYLLLVWKSLSGSVGLLTAFVISIILSIKRRWFWFNSFLSFLLVLFLLKLPFWDYTKQLFYYPGQLFSNSLLKFLTNCILLLLIGLLFFFLKPINRFISGSKS